VFYCGVPHQKADWKQHKLHCVSRDIYVAGDAERPWWRKIGSCASCSARHSPARSCSPIQATPEHTGNLDLIVWPHQDNLEGYYGWGGGRNEMEAEALRKVFEVDCLKDEVKFYQTQPASFRWSCCGTTGMSGRLGCTERAARTGAERQARVCLVISDELPSGGGNGIEEVD
jgi:hypothetical protein